MADFDAMSEPLPRRLRDGLERLATVLKADQWSAANAVGLNPTQGLVLSFLAGRGANGMRVKDVAAHLGVTQPTATDSVNALERKGLVRKGADADDARAIAVRVTAAGKTAVKAIGLTTMATDRALAALTPGEQADMLLLVTKLIRSLQIAGALPDQRICATCKYFQPHAHASADKPHHCAFVNAAFGARHLRLDCAEHEPAEPSVQAEIWRRFAPETSAPS
jgi:DNA-binding MarR family transcriptional regulator